MKHGCVGAAVLTPGSGVGWPVHVGQERHFLYPQAVDDDVDMNVSTVVVSVRVGTDKRLMSGEMLTAKPLAKLLRPVYGQAVVRAVPRVKADDVVVTFYIPALPVLPVAEIRPHTGNSCALSKCVDHFSCIPIGMGTSIQNQ